MQVLRILFAVFLLVLVLWPPTGPPSVLAQEQDSGTTQMLLVGPAITSDTGHATTAMGETAVLAWTADVYTHWFSTAMVDTSVASATARSGVTFEVSTDSAIADDSTSAFAVFRNYVRNNFGGTALNTAEFGFVVGNSTTTNGETVAKAAVQREVNTDDFVSSHYRPLLAAEFYDEVLS